MNRNNVRPFVVLIDDKPEEEEARATTLSFRGLDVVVRTPQAVTLEDVKRASVIAVDEYLDWEDGSCPETPVFHPVDGLAVVRVLQRHAVEAHASPAFVLRSGELAKLGASLPAAVRESAIATQHDLDWAFNKQDPQEGARIAVLAKATYNVHDAFGQVRHWDGGAGWLNLQESDWSMSAISQVDACRPPDTSVASYTSGSSWLRWFTQKILPYPTFLLSDRHAALRLRLSSSSFAEATSGDSQLSIQLAKYCYSGSLENFSGRRWWRAGIEAFVDGLLADSDWDSSEADILSRRLQEMHGSELDVLTQEHPVVPIDAEYAEQDIVDASCAVRLSPDLWPVFADEPWATISDVQGDEGLQIMISREDRQRFESLRN